MEILWKPPSSSAATVKPAMVEDKLSAWHLLAVEAALHPKNSINISGLGYLAIILHTVTLSDNTATIEE